jgi:hypothetical protein
MTTKTHAHTNELFTFISLRDKFLVDTKRDSKRRSNAHRLAEVIAEQGDLGERRLRGCFCLWTDVLLDDGPDDMTAFTSFGTKAFGRGPPVSTFGKGAYRQGRGALCGSEFIPTGRRVETRAAENPRTSPSRNLSFASFSRARDCA